MVYSSSSLLHNDSCNFVEAVVPPACLPWSVLCMGNQSLLMYVHARGCFLQWLIVLPPACLSWSALCMGNQSLLVAMYVHARDCSLWWLTVLSPSYLPRTVLCMGTALEKSSLPSWHAKRTITTSCATWTQSGLTRPGTCIIKMQLCVCVSLAAVDTTG